MKIGFMADYCDEAIKFAKDVGFGSLEILAHPGTKFSEIAFNSQGIEKIKRSFEKSGVSISAIAFHPNHLESDMEKRKLSADYFLKLMDATAALGVGVIATFVGRDPEKSIEDNIPIFKEVFSPYIEKAEKLSLKIAIENCPLMGGYPIKGVNFAFSPKAWDLMFEAIPSRTLGLEFDPSHLFWLGVDCVKAVYKYRDRIYHVHTKDTEILHEKLNSETIFGRGWWRYRIPGWGDIDWQKFISALYDIGYDGPLTIEQEDPIFRGKRFNDGRFNEGLILGFKYLSQFVTTV